MQLADLLSCRTPDPLAVARLSFIMIGYILGSSSPEPGSDDDGSASLYSVPNSPFVRSSTGTIIASLATIVAASLAASLTECS